MNIPAFPLHNHGAQTLGMHLSGMTLRDYFAAKALRSAIEEMWATSEDKNEAATIAYQYADAMMKAREKDET
jgi:hypothetical protein